MKLSRLIDKLQKTHKEYGDMQVYAFGRKVKPTLCQKGEDELFIDFSME